ncbi:ArnT family glycosyltransferase [Humisphaera borealis]|uniref:Glycosyltransferase family 39 protein n=1 Tax=Humisphaera borealis TaxID=2807512 RepID=A0A7M2WUG5_9BACT|nr:glycosyltransferase family 39 protein [Humisphaera borealis]QOV89148.1 glycosyltransferase family 39 protein [Humisphaera borealis]
MRFTTLCPMPGPRSLLVLLLFCATGVFLTGIQWGLPSRDADRYLFGDKTPWTGPQVQMLADLGSATPWDDPSRGADVDANPLRKALQLRKQIDLHAATISTSQPASQPSTESSTESPATVPVRSGDAPQSTAAVVESQVESGGIVVNSTDSARAEIVRRYRLFSHQPDEFITFAALAKMRPANFDFDPRLYQYGGLWVYPVGLLLKVASVVGYVDLRGGGGGLSYYLDHPDAFGRFYVVARLYSAFWGVIGAWALFAIVRRITASQWAAFAAGLLFVIMPVVVNAAHEAKPHLAGFTLTLLAVLAAASYVETGKLSHAIGTGVVCGLALGMVLSALPVFAILPLMVLLRPMSWGDRGRVAIFAGLVGLLAYALTNPYVAVHLLRGGGALQSNLGNSKAFYDIHSPVEGVINVARLIIVGTSPALAIAGALGTVILGVRAVRTRRETSPQAVRRRAHGLLLAGPAILTAIQWSLVGAGKPGEFGRFLLTTDVFLAVEAVVLIQTYARNKIAASLLFSVVAVQTSLRGTSYIAGFVRDSGAPTSRDLAAEQIDQASKSGARRIVLAAEPAPYAIPPMNLWAWEMVVPPSGQTAASVARPGDRVVEALEGQTPISWADKPIDVRTAK